MVRLYKFTLMIREYLSSVNLDWDLFKKVISIRQVILKSTYFVIASGKLIFLTIITQHNRNMCDQN
jgi:hypothetical protein